jgi:hypothetical protein
MVMAKQRYISTALWDDEWFVEELDAKEKLFFLYLLTNEHTNIAGIYKLSIRKIALESGFSPDDVMVMFMTLEDSKKVYYRDNHVIMVNWPKHQNWKSSDRIHKGLRAILIKEIPYRVINLIREEDIPYTYPIDTLSNGIGDLSNGIDKEGISHIYPSNYIDSDSDSNSNSNSDSDSNSDSKIERGDAKAPTTTPKRKQFIKPTLDQVKEYCKERNNSVDPEKFIDFYDSKGWMVGKNKMVDWKGSVRTWEKGDNAQGRASPSGFKKVGKEDYPLDMSGYETI